MDKKIIAAISLGLLFTAFGIISLLVIVTKRHPYFVGKKLRLGALIISLTGMSAGCPIVQCYSPVQYNIFRIDQADTQNGLIVIKKSVSDSITGKIYERHGNTFSYIVADSSDSIIIKENLAPEDGAFDENTEEIIVRFGNTIMPGNYELRFYTAPKDSIKNTDWCSMSYPLQITD
jgi:hypothetical protein